MDADKLAAVRNRRAQHEWSGVNLDAVANLAAIGKSAIYPRRKTKRDLLRRRAAGGTGAASCSTRSMARRSSTSWFAPLGATRDELEATSLSMCPQPRGHPSLPASPRRRPVRACPDCAGVVPAAIPCDIAYVSPVLVALCVLFARMDLWGGPAGGPGHTPLKEEAIPMWASSQERLVVVPSSPGSPPPRAVYSRAVPKSPGIPTPGWTAAGVVPKSPGSPPPGTSESEAVPMSPGPSPESFRPVA